jgi:hypothetical protein
MQLVLNLLDNDLLLIGEPHSLAVKPVPHAIEKILFVPGQVPITQGPADEHPKGLHLIRRKRRLGDEGFALFSP